MTRDHDNAFKRQFAFQATLIGMIAILFAATSGANTLKKWGVSVRFVDDGGWGVPGKLRKM